MGYNINYENNAVFIIDLINVSKNNKYGLILNISYKKQNDYFEFPILPPEINELIHSFNYYSIKLKCILQYPHDYPFTPVTWGLLSTYFNKINLDEYYKNIIKEHNIINKQNWQPVHRIHHDILNFITRISDFESIIQLII